MKDKGLDEDTSCRNVYWHNNRYDAGTYSKNLSCLSVLTSSRVAGNCLNVDGQKMCLSCGYFSRLTQSISPRT